MTIEKKADREEWKACLSGGCVFTGGHEAAKWGLEGYEFMQTLKIIPTKPVRVSAPGMNSSYLKIRAIEKTSQPINEERRK